MKTFTYYTPSHLKNKLFLFLTITLLFSFSKVGLAQAPTLGATASFALFTATGAFDNTGATIITGDIGTNVGLLTGFPPGTLIGQMHVADGVSAQAAIDVDLAYTFLNAITCDTTIGTTLGNNQTLTPRVYCMIAASSLTGDLILDGQGDSNAIFNFKVNGAFVSNSFSRVILINSASHKNIYWQVNGSVTLGDSSELKGTVIANGAINLLNGSELVGRGLSRGGAISINNSVSALPVKLLSFNVVSNKETNILKWSTSSEVNNAYYLIERSIDGKHWKPIGKVTGAKNSVTLKKYLFVDQEANNGLKYYRLKQTDYDGKFEYSAIVSIGKNNVDVVELAIYPNPTNGQVNFAFSDSDDYSLTIYNLMGEKVYQLLNCQSVIDVSNFKEGFYTLQLTSSSKIITRKLVVKK